MEKRLRQIWAKYIITYASVALLVMLLLLPIYQIAYRQARSVTLRETEYAIQKNIDSLERDLYALDQYMGGLLSSEEVVHMAYLRDENHYHLALAMRLADELLDSVAQYALIADDIVISFLRSDYVVSRGKVTSRSGYYGSAISYDDYTQAEYERALYQERLPMLPVQPVRTNYHSQSIRALTRNYFGNTREHAYVAASAIISESTLAGIMLTGGIEENGFLTVSDVRGNTLISYGADQVDRRDCTILNTQSESGALRVEIGIHNRVFEQSALPVRRTITLYSAAALLIAAIMAILFGTRQYMPVRDYLRYVQSQGIGILQVHRNIAVGDLVSSSLDGLRYQYNALQDSIRQLEQRHKDMLLFNLLGGMHVSQEDVQTHLAGEKALLGTYLVLRMHLEGDDISLAETEALYADISARLETAFAATYVLSQVNYIAILAIDPQRTEDAYEVLKQLSHELHRYGGTVVSFVASSPYAGIDKLSVAYSEVRLLVRNIHAFEQDRAFFRYDQLSEYTAGTNLSLYRPDDLYTMLLSGNGEHVQQYMQVLLRQFASISLLHPQRAGVLYYGILDVLDNATQKLGGRLDAQAFDINARYEDVAGYLMDTAMDIAAAARVEPKGNQKREILDYIETHYSQSDICLSLLADEFGLSEAHISRVIKAQTGLTYSEYIEAIRMKRAAELLADADLSIGEISLRLGYENQSTFFKAFKRTYHVPPSSFRRNPNGQA